MKKNIAIGVLGLLACLVTEFGETFELAQQHIVVGVRSDSRPFSYKVSDTESDGVLSGYRGYSIDICKNVLQQMTESGPFRDFGVLAVEVDAEDRFEYLESGKIDMLCGPDSITMGRLNKFNITIPVFLSGISYVTLETDFLPRDKYCKGVVGVLSGTTAETYGLRILSKNRTFQRFNTSVEEFLSIRSVGNPEPYIESLFSKLENFLNENKWNNGKQEDSYTKGHGESLVSPSEVKTKECPNGHEAGPVVSYSNHSDGINDLCEGIIFYYVGDVDIVTQLSQLCEDKIVHGDRTFTKEAYGMFFRKENEWEMNSSSSGYTGFDSLLYSQFNSLLIAKVQESENILNYIFRKTFEGKKATDELQEFFDGYQYVVD